MSAAIAERAPHAASARRHRLASIGLTLLSALVLLVAWDRAVVWLDVPPYILPPPQRVLVALWSGLAVPPDSPLGWYRPLWGTLSNAAIGFVVGAGLGLVLGSAMAEFRALERLLMPYAFALQSLPKVAIAPLVVIWLGFGDGSKIAMAALLTFFPMLVNTFAGVRAADAQAIDLMRGLSASRLETYLIVKLPTAAPYVFAGIDMGVVYALLGTIVAEFLGAQRGMGVAITQAQAVTDVAGVFAALVILGSVGIALHAMVRIAERRVIHWRDRRHD